ncbi:MAG: hypothetical protein JWO06_275 [Bacteroidota bacterium]|nr:hypothetical protein [Bacteroidota bacterium]
MNRSAGVLCFLLALGCFCHAQDNVYMKDGKLLGDRKTLVKSCVEGMGHTDSSSNHEGICDCMITTLATHFTFKEFMKLVEKGDMDFVKLMKDKKKGGFGDDVMKCVFAYTAEMKKGDTSQGEFQKDFLKSCIAEAAGKEQMRGYDPETYCICMFNQMKAGGLDLSALVEAKKDLNNPKIQEMVVPCLQKARVEQTIEAAGDISGPSDKGEVPLLALGNIHRVKLRFGNIEKYFTLDSGASDVLMSKDLEKELLKSGALLKSDYVGEQTYYLADGSKVRGKNYYLSGIGIGDFTVNKVMIGVLESDKASLLCGKSLLGKFSAWRVDNTNSKLILTK